MECVRVRVRERDMPILLHMHGLKTSNKIFQRGMINALNSSKLYIVQSKVWGSEIKHIKFNAEWLFALE